MSHCRQILGLQDMTRYVLMGEGQGPKVKAQKVARGVLSLCFEDPLGPDELQEMSNIRMKG